MTEFQDWANKIGAIHQRITEETRQTLLLYSNMKFTINSSELTKALEQAAKFVSAKPLMPILGNLKLVATEERLEITGFNLSHGIEIKCPDIEVISSGDVCIPVSAIATVKLMSGQLIIEVDENHLISISSLAGSVDIQGQSNEEYPNLIDKDFNPKNKHIIDAKTFNKAIEFCAPFATTDESKPILSGINISAHDGVLRAIATDGHRLAACNVAVNDVSIDSTTIPSKSLSIANLPDFGLCHLSIDNSQVTIDAKNTAIMRTIDGKYPDAMMLVPKSFSRSVEVDRRELIGTLNLMNTIGNSNGLVKFSINSRDISISSSSDGKKGKSKLTCNLIGQPIDLAFNLKYLIDGLKMFDTKLIKISINEPLHPVVITEIDSDVDRLYLVMPIQLRA